MYISYDTLSAEMSRLGLPLDGSMLQGYVTGHLTSTAQPPHPWSLAAFLGLPEGTQPQTPNLNEVLTRMGSDIDDQLTGIAMGYELLLPGDDIALSERLDALAGWCRGFLGGLAEAQGFDSVSIDEELQHALRDVVAISQIDTETEETEAAEADFTELVEYLRVIACSLYLEFRNSPTPQAPPPMRQLH